MNLQKDTFTHAVKDNILTFQTIFPLLQSFTSFRSPKAAEGKSHITLKILMQSQSGISVK